MHTSTPILILLLLPAFTGCLSPDTLGAPTASGPSIETSPPGNSKAPLKPQFPLDVGFNGIDCELFTLNIRGPGAPAQARAPSDFNVYGDSNVATYFFFVQHCKSAVLGDAALAEDVWTAILLVQGDPADNSTADLHGYTLEAFTDWQPLHEAWLAEGMTNAHLGSFSQITGDSAIGFNLQAGDIEYHVEPLAGRDEPAQRGPTKYRLYAGNGTTVFDYVIGRPEQDFLPHAALMTITGGFLSQIGAEANAAVLVNGHGSIRLKNLEYI